MKPLFLLADSQLLFARIDGEPFALRVGEALGAGERSAAIRASYLGASNGDQPEFFELFRSAIDPLRAVEPRMIPSIPSPDERAWLAESELVVLAGGDPAAGWAAFEKEGLVEVLRTRYAEGAVLLGVSAGAMQLGTRGWRRDGDRCVDAFDALGIVPYIVDAHDDPDWIGLYAMVTAAGPLGRGLGLSRGGGAVIYPDLTVEPLRATVVEIDHAADALRSSLLVPRNAADPAKPG